MRDALPIHRDDNLPGRLFPLSDVPNHPAAPLGRGGRPLPLKTVRNWVAAGKLRTTVINGRRFCCVAWIQEMIGTGEPSQPAGRSSSQRKRSHERASAECAAAGL